VARWEVPTDFQSICHPGAAGVLACPCSNPPAGILRGCDNSASTGGASLVAAGSPSLTADTLVFSTQSETPVATSILLQSVTPTTGAVRGQGICCISGSQKRLYVKTAVGGSIITPQLGDARVSVRSALLGDTITAGTQRYYQVCYRDPFVLGACAATATLNVTQAIDVRWSP